MLQYVADQKYAEAFAAVYNSANTLFGESERRDADAALFAAQMDENENLAVFSASGEVTAFLSFHRTGESYELSALYVQREHQREGRGTELLRAFEERLPAGSVIFAKVLKNAPWAMAFYRRNGFAPVDGGMREAAAALGITDKPWSAVLYKVAGRKL